MNNKEIFARNRHYEVLIDQKTQKIQELDDYLTELFKNIPPTPSALLEIYHKDRRRYEEECEVFYAAMRNIRNVLNQIVMHNRDKERYIDKVQIVPGYLPNGRRVKLRPVSTAKEDILPF